MYWQRNWYHFNTCRSCSYEPFIIPKIVHCAFFFSFSLTKGQWIFLVFSKDQFWAWWVLYKKRGRVGCLLRSLLCAATDLFFWAANTQKTVFKFNSLASTSLSIPCLFIPWHENVLLSCQLMNAYFINHLQLFLWSYFPSICWVCHVYGHVLPFIPTFHLQNFAC